MKLKIIDYVKLIVLFLCTAGVCIIGWKNFHDENIDLLIKRELGSIIIKDEMETGKLLDMAIENFNLADTLAEKGEKIDAFRKFDISLHYLKAVIKRDSKNLLANVYMGMVYAMIAEGEESVAEKMDYIEMAFSRFDYVLSVDPDNCLSLFYRGVVSTEVPDMIFHRLTKGIRDLKKIELIFESNQCIDTIYYKHVYYYLGKGLFESGEMNEAAYYLKRAQSLCNNEGLCKKCAVLLKQIK